uniref:EF-hand domain-containing protein n=1 Tax=Ornithorhynchus anatinus TaxID=9258 RepID=A0A6I8NM71_ORNAN
ERGSAPSSSSPFPPRPALREGRGDWVPSGSRARSDPGPEGRERKRAGAWEGAGPRPSPGRRASQQDGGGERQRREIGTIIRSLGCCPTEGELHDLIAEVEEDEPTGYIHLEKFIPMMTKVLMEKRYRPIPEDVLLRAFEVLDPSQRGHLTKEELVKFMTEEGEPFTQEEMEEMLSAAVDPESNVINYRDYLSMMVVEDN